MRAAILAGGMGTRLSGLYKDIPKPMIPVAGKPVLQHQLESLAGQNIKDITLIIGHMSEVVVDFFGNGADFGVNIEYIIEDEPLGTGGAISMLPREDTIVLMGDVYFDIDFTQFIHFHREQDAGVSLFAHPNSHPYDSDIVVVGNNHRVIEWASKNAVRQKDYRNLVNAGICIFNANVLPKGAAVKRDIEKDLITPLIPSGQVCAYRSTEYVKDMGTPERLRIVERDITDGVAAARNLKKKQRAVFLDRDGTIVMESGFIKCPEQVQLTSEASKAIRLLNSSEFLTICITNQPVIARGDVTFEGLEAIHARLDVLLGKDGAYLDDLFFCPHHPDKGFEGERPEYKKICECRKPEPGMLLKAAGKYNIDLSQSIMIGDSTADIAAGRAVGCKSYGLRTGMALQDGKYKVSPDGVFNTLLEVVEKILSEDA